ncbi:MAG: hypothetical protein DRI23_06930 [Candidatus Cloacimonadota bacterium]|nr:MAG: hypothetical protein DRI23_06930 [Candidatus Cloacimonadota bacterium]
MVRINKYLAKCNVGSRRKVEEFILAGRVQVNGKKVTDLAYQIDQETDKVKFDNKLLELPQETIYIMLNKPVNYLVTAKDDFDRKTVFDILPDFKTHLFSIGRLDYMSDGLLLLTNDGDFADKIIHPRNKLPKVYKVTIKGKLDKSALEKLRSGVVIDGKKTNPAIVHVNSSAENKSVLKMTIFEGRKRQIRYMIKAVGSEVLQLRRLQIGDVKLGNLPVGMWRILKPKEVESLLRYSSSNRKIKSKDNK